MRELTPLKIAEITGGRLVCPPHLCHTEITGVTTDSRKVKAGCLFAAIKGERADGHDYIPAVMKAGALIALAEREDAAGEGPCILVPSSEEAIRRIAAFYFDVMNVPTVAITGSVGKTSTKETIASVLAVRGNTMKTQGNFNNELGVPLTVFNLTDDHKMAVIEMGISHFGDMKILGGIVKPDIAVITNIGTAHLEYLNDRDGVFREKTDIFNYLREGGRAVLNGDDDKLRQVEEVRGTKPVFFGLGDTNDYRAEEIRSLGFRGTACRIVTPDSSFEAVIPIPGEHMVYNALAACAVGQIMGLSDDEIKEGLKNVEALEGRFHVMETEDLIIIDDAYNANPMSVKAALKILTDSADAGSSEEETERAVSGRRIAVLGDMAELGNDAEKLHREVGLFMKDYAPDILITAGTLAEWISKGAEGLVKDNHWYPDAETMKKALPDLIRKGDTVLVKASHCMHFDEIVKVLKEWRFS